MSAYFSVRVETPYHGRIFYARCHFSILNETLALACRALESILPELSQPGIGLTFVVEPA